MELSKMKKLTIIFLFIAAAVAGCQEKKGQNIDLDVVEFEQRILEENAFVLDVRTPDEVSDGIIEGATVLNILGDEFLERYGELPKDKTIYVYCRSGNRSRKAVAFLKNKGYDSIYHLQGGMKAWLQANKKIK